MDKPIHACLIVDDTPASPAYWVRLQQTAFGYTPTTNTFWGKNWPALAPAGLWRPSDARAFADLIDEFNIRGKCSLLACPSGLGRIDQSVRGYTDAELKELLAIMRDRIQPRMDITPEVVTHSMALDLDSGALLPHAESAWVTHLAATRQMDRLKEYLRFAFTILRNVGIAAHGLCVGGMSDPSNIGKGESLLTGHHREALSEALLSVEREFDPKRTFSFMYTGSLPLTEQGRSVRAPETIYRSPDNGRVFEVFSHGEDPLLPMLYGDREALAAATDAMISPDLERGELVAEAEAGRAVVFTIHSQTLISLNTGLGQSCLREAMKRFHQRYGKRIVWLKTSELCEKLGVTT